MDWVGTWYGDPLLPVADLESIARVLLYTVYTMSPQTWWYLLP